MDFVNINGTKVNLDYLARKHAKPKPKKAEKDEHFSRGILVLGIEPGSFEAAQRQREVEIDAAIENNADTKKQRMQVPDALTLDMFLRTAKRKKLPRRFEIRDAAELLADMLRKAGWLAVEVLDDTGARK